MLTPREKLILDLFPAGFSWEADLIANKAKEDVRQAVKSALDNHEPLDDRSDIEKSIVEELELLVKENI